MFTTLFPNREKVSSCGSLGKATDKAAPVELRNRFGILGDPEPDMIQAINIEDDEESAPGSSLPAPESQARTLSETSTLEDDPIVPLIRIHLFLRVSIIQQTYRCSNSDVTVFRNWIQSARPSNHSGSKPPMKLCHFHSQHGLQTLPMKPQRGGAQL